MITLNSSNVMDNAVADYQLDISNDVANVVSLLCYVIISPLVSVFGILANVINAFIYYKHGLNESVNISFLTLSVTDVTGLTFCFWYGIGVSPLLIARKDLDYSAVDVAYLTGAWPRLLLSKITCWITVFIAVERCVCIVSPLHVKTLITPRKTIFSMAILYIVAVLTNFPLLYLRALYLTWKRDPVSNRSFLGMATSPEYNNINAFASPINTISFLTSFAIIILSTITLIVGLNRKSKWRLRSSNFSSFRAAQGISKRDKTLSKTIVLLSAVVIGSYLPYTANCILSTILEGFGPYGKYNNFFQVMWSFSWLFETLNSTTSIFIYYSMSTKYKHTLNHIFSRSCSCRLLQPLQKLYSKM